MYRPAKQQPAVSTMSSRQKTTRTFSSTGDTPSHIRQHSSATLIASGIHEHKPQDQTAEGDPKRLATPVKEIFNSTAISEAYFNRCQQLQRVCDQIRERQEQLPYLTQLANERREQHSQLSSRLKSLQGKAGWTSRRYDMNLERYNFRIVDLEAQIQSEKNELSLRQTLDEAAIQKLIREMTNLERSRNMEQRQQRSQPSSPVSGKSVRFRAASPSDKVASLTSSRVAIANSRRIMELTDLLQRKSLKLREVKMVRQKYEYDLNALRLSNSFQRDRKDITLAQQKISRETSDSPRCGSKLSLPFPKATVSVESRDDLAFRISVLQTRLESDRTIKQTQSRAILNDIVSSTAAHQAKLELLLRARPSSLPSYGRNYIGKEVAYAKQKELTGLKKEEEALSKDVQQATNNGVRLKAQLEELVKERLATAEQEQRNLEEQQAKTDMFKEELEFINTSNKALEVELIRLRNQVSALSNEFGSLDFSKNNKALSRRQIDSLASEALRMKRENDWLAVTLSEKSDRAKSKSGSDNGNETGSPESMSQQELEECNRLQQQNNLLQANLSQILLRLKEYEYLVELQVRSEIGEWQEIIQQQKEHLESLEQPKIQRRISCPSPTRDLEPIAETVEQENYTQPQRLQHEETQESLSERLETEVFSGSHSRTKMVVCCLMLSLQFILLLYLMSGWTTWFQQPKRPTHKRRAPK